MASAGRSPTRPQNLCREAPSPGPWQSSELPQWWFCAFRDHLQGLAWRLPAH